MKILFQQMDIEPLFNLGYLARLRYFQEKSILQLPTESHFVLLLTLLKTFMNTNKNNGI
jgi:hypothetical protein